MKKTILLAISSLLLAFGAKATHLMGGDLIAALDSTGKYHITLSYYRDTLGIPLNHYYENVLVYQYSATTNTYTQIRVIQLDYDSVQSQLQVPSFPYGVETGIYVNDTITLPVGSYRLVSNTCCRNGAILNATDPMAESIVLYTDLNVTTAGNSTPNFLAMPIAHFEVNVPAFYNPLPFDPDADSIAWALNTPIGNTNNVSVNPLFSPVLGFATPAGTASGPFTMNAVTGQVTWTPPNTGNYIQSFKITEYKAGVATGTIIRDMQYLVLPADTNAPQPVFVNISPYNTNTQQHYNYLYYTPGQPLTFQIGSATPNVNSVLTLSSFGEPYQLANPASFTVTGTNNNKTGTFNWTPAANLTRDVLVIFRTGNGVFSKDFTLLLRKTPSSTGIGTPSGIVNSFAVYPNPAKSELHVSLDLAERTAGQVALYNTVGQKVLTLFDGAMPKGKLQFSSALNVAAGTYFVVLRNESGTLQTKTLNVQ